MDRQRKLYEDNIPTRMSPVFEFDSHHDHCSLCHAEAGTYVKVIAAFDDRRVRYLCRRCIQEIYNFANGPAYTRWLEDEVVSLRVDAKRSQAITTEEQTDATQP